MRDPSDHCSCGQDLQAEKPLHSLPAYQYGSLQSEESTRLFRLHDARDLFTPIGGSLEEVILPNSHDHFEPRPRSASDLSYLALSYTWASEARPHAIQCDGYKLYVTCSLNSALRRLRSLEREESLIFADCICINQSTDTSGRQEREKQVKLMHQIFAGATKVIADLGEHADDSARILAIFEQLVHVRNATETAAQELAMARERRLPLFKDSVLGALVKFCERRWFTRLWVVQEAVLASEFQFLVGQTLVSFDLVYLGILTAQRLLHNVITSSLFAVGLMDRYIVWRTQRPQIDAAAAQIFEIHSIKTLRSFKTSSVAQLLEMTRRFSVTCQHDKIYAIMGMMRQSSVAKFAVDYSEDIDSLAKRLSAFVIEEGGLGIALSLLASYQSSASGSWTYDFVRPAQSGTRVRWTPSDDDGQIQCSFNACGDTKPTFKWDSSNGGVLFTRGSAMGTITCISEPLPGGLVPTLWNTAWEMIQWESTFQKVACAHFNKRPASDVQRQYLEVIVAGGRMGPRLASFGAQGSDIQGKLGECIQAALTMKPLNLLRWIVTSPRSLRDMTTLKRNSEAYVRNMLLCSAQRRVCITDRGHMGVAPPEVVVGDRFVIFAGCPEPFVVRRTAEYHELIGPAYLHGWMDGEGPTSQMWQEEEFELR